MSQCFFLLFGMSHFIFASLYVLLIDLLSFHVAVSGRVLGKLSLTYDAKGTFKRIKLILNAALRRPRMERERERADEVKGEREWKNW